MHHFRCNIYPADGLDTRLHESSALCIEAELVNELLDVSDLIKLTFTLFLSNGVLLEFSSLECFEITLVIVELLALEVDDLIYSSVKEVTSMGNNDDCNVEVNDVVF